MQNQKEALRGFDSTRESVEAICKSLTAICPVDMDNLLVALRDLLYCRIPNYDCHFIKKQEPSYGCRSPHMELIMENGTPVLCIVCFKNDKYDAPIARTYYLEQIALAVILSLSSPSFVDGISPEETMQSFCAGYPEHGRLVLRVYNLLDKIVK